MSTTAGLNSSSWNLNDITMDGVNTGTDSQAADAVIPAEDQKKKNVTAAPVRVSVIQPNPNATQNQQSDPNIADPAQSTSAGRRLVQDFHICAYGFCFQVQQKSDSMSMGVLVKATCWSISQNQKMWDCYIGAPVTCCSLSPKYVLMFSLDGALRFLNIRNGVSVLMVLNLSAVVFHSSFCPSGKYGGIISECGEVRIWDIDQQIICIASSLAEIMKVGRSTIGNFTITKDGNPLVMFSNGKSYSYSMNMLCWMVLTSDDPIMQLGLKTSIPRGLPPNTQNLPLMSIQATSKISQANFLDWNSNNWQASGKQNFIENQIKLCEALNSPEELKYWYSMLAYHLAFHGTEQRVRFFLDELLGITGTFSPAARRRTLNIENHVLLEAVLNTFRLVPRWQRIYMEYNEMLKLFKRRSGIE